MNDTGADEVAEERTRPTADLARWWPRTGAGLRLVLLCATLAACSGTPDAPRKVYDVSVDFLQLAQGQCLAVSSFTNRYQEPLRISGDIRFLDRAGRRVSNVALLTAILEPGQKAKLTHSLMQIFNDDDLNRCRSVSSYQVKVSLCRTGAGRYLDGRSCVGELHGPLTW